MVSSRGFIKSITEKGINKKKIQYFPQWSEEIFENKSDNKQELKYLIPNGFVVMFAGNIGEAQDFPSIIDSAIRLKTYTDLHWVIVGSGSREEWLKEAIEKHGLKQNFHLIGQFPMGDMPELYSYADALFISLKKEYIFSLTVPAKLQTYLASGKPILTMLDGEASKIVKEANAGLISPAGDSKVFAKNVIALKSIKPSELNKFGQNGSLYFQKHFKSTTLLNKAEEVFFSLTRQ